MGQYCSGYGACEGCTPPELYNAWVKIRKTTLRLKKEYIARVGQKVVDAELKRQVGPVPRGIWDDLQPHNAEYLAVVARYPKPEVVVCTKETYPDMNPEVSV